MAFNNDIKTAMNSDASVNAYATVVYEFLPIDYNINKDWVTYGFVFKEGDLTIGNSKINNYDLIVEVRSKDIDKIYLISDLLINKLTSYDDGKIRIIEFLDEDMSYNIEREVFIKTHRFDVRYEIN